MTKWLKLLWLLGGNIFVHIEYTLLKQFQNFIQAVIRVRLNGAFSALLTLFWLRIFKEKKDFRCPTSK